MVRRAHTVGIAVAWSAAAWFAVELMFLPLAAHAAVTLIQTASNSSGGNGATSISATFGTVPAAGDLLIAVLGASGNTAINVPSGWSTAVSTAGTVSQAIFYKVAGAAEPTTVTVTTASSFALGIQIYEYSGVSPNSPLDQATSTAGTGTATNGGSVATTQPDELLFAASTIAGQTSFSSWSNSFTLENNFSNSSGNKNNRATYSGAQRIVNATGTYSTVGTAGTSASWVGQIVSFRAQITFTQAAYRWFANTDSTSVGSPLAIENTSTVRTTFGTPFRLRMLVNVATDQLGTGSRSFKLQFANMGTGTCAAPTGAYADVATSTGYIEFYNNPTPANGDPLTPTSTDPVDGTNAIVNETYVEGNTFTNSVGAVPVGEDGKWDFSLVDNNAPGGATFCFRAVESDGTPFASYANYPALIIGNVPPTVSNVTLNGGNDIALIEGTTTLISATATVTEANGYADLYSVSSTLYRTSLGPSCAADPNDCYQGTPSACSLSGCSGTSCTATCNFNVWYFAQPTDAGTPWAGDSWSAAMTAANLAGSTGTASSTGVTLLSLLAFETTSTIDYGSFSQGTVMPNLTATSVIRSSGNVAMNVNVYGTNMVNGTYSIPVGDQHFATSVLSYASGTALLANPGSTVAIDLPKPTSTAAIQSSTFYWGLAIPSGQMATTYTGGNSFIGVKLPLPWP